MSSTTTTTCYYCKRVQKDKEVWLKVYIANRNDLTIGFGEAHMYEGGYVWKDACSKRCGLALLSDMINTEHYENVRP